MLKSYLAVAFAFTLITSVRGLAAEAAEEKAQGANSTNVLVTREKKPIGLNVSAQSFFMGFDGEQRARGGLYGFGNVTYWQQLLMATYQLPDLWTISAIGSYQQIFAESDVLVGNQRFFSRDQTEGIGDTRLMATKMFIMNPSRFFIAETSVSLPTGSTSEKNKNNTQFNYPYLMQLGSGTVDPSIAGTLIQKTGSFTHNLRLQTIWRTGRGVNGYRLGHEYMGMAWSEYQGLPYVTPLLRATYRHRDPIGGSDITYGRNPALRRYVEFFHGDQINWDVTLAAKTSLPIMGRQDLKLNMEAGVPLVQGLQNVDDVLLYISYYAQLGVMGTF